MDEDLKFSDDEVDMDLPLDPLKGSEDVRIKSEEDIKPAINNQHPISGKIVSILTPEEFYFVPENDENWGRLQSAVNDYVKDPMRHAPPVESLRERDWLIVFSETFNNWCRAIYVGVGLPDNRSRMTDILKRVSQPIIVWLIDYHYNDKVCQMNIREAPEHLKDTKKYPSSSIRASLAGVACIGKAWSDSLEALDHMKRLVLGKDVVLFNQKRNGDPYPFWKVSVGFKLEGISIGLISLRDALLTAGVAQRGHTEPFRLPPDQFAAETYRNHRMPKPRDVFTGVISYTETPDLFYVNQAADSNRLLEQQDALQTFYEAHNESFRILHIHEGLPVVAKYADDGFFYRGQVKHLDTEKRNAGVQFVDYGNCQTCDWKDLCYVASQFMENEKLCIPCCLGTIEPSPTLGECGFKWGENATSHLQLLLAGADGTYADSHLGVQVWGLVSSNTKLNVNLHKYLKNGDEVLDISEAMVRAKFAVKKQLDLSQEDNHKLQSIALQQNISCYVILKEIQERQMMAKSSKKESLIPVRILKIFSPSQFYIQLQDRNILRMFVEFSSNMMKTVKQLFNSHQLRHIKDPQVGQKFLFKIKFQDGEVWRRGKILDMKQSEDGSKKFDIMSIDGAEFFSGIPPSEIWEIHDTLLKHDAYAIECRISDVTPAGGDKWTQSALDRFQDFCKIHKESMFILLKDQLTDVKQEPLMVNLFAIEKTVPDAFLPAKITYHSVADLLTGEWGVAFSNRKSGEVSDHDELNECVDPELPVATPRIMRGPKDIQVSSGIYSKLVSLIPDDINPSTAFYYAPPEDPPSTVFKGLVTNVDSDANIYFQVVTVGRMRVTQVNSEISKGIVEGSMPSYMGSFAEGRACTAKFTCDNTWNRAKILGTVPGGSHLIRVQYVDYGNEEHLFLEQLTSKVFAKQIPELALKAKLYGCKVLNPERKSKLIEVLYDTLIDKQCEFTWMVCVTDTLCYPLSICLLILSNLNRTLLKETR